MSVVYVIDPTPGLGSAMMRGRQMAVETGGRVMTLPEFVKRPDGQTVVFVKVWPEESVLDKLRASRFLVFDTVDLLAMDYGEERFVTGPMHKFDMIFVPTEAARGRLYSHRYLGVVHVLPHHWDPRLPQIGFHGPVQFGFMGTAKGMRDNLVHSRVLNDFGLRVFDTETGQDVTGWPDEKVAELKHRANNLDALTDLPFNCHLSIRDPNGVHYKFKTNAKVSTAAALGQPIVTTRENAAVELLGDDYPLFIPNPPDEHTVREFLYNLMRPQSKWLFQDALKRLQAAREETKLSKVAADALLAMKRARAVTQYVDALRVVCSAIKPRGSRLVYRAYFGKLEPEEGEGPMVDHLRADNAISTDYILFTDNPELKVSAPYRVVVVPTIDPEPFEGIIMRRASASAAGTVCNRVLKMLGPELLPQYDVSMYIDVQLDPSDDENELLRAVSSRRPIALHRHRSRKNIHEEIFHLVRQGVITREWGDRYLAAVNVTRPGSVLSDPLTENGVLVRKHGSTRLRSAMRMWLSSFIFIISRDQVHLPYVTRVLNIQPNYLADTVKPRTLTKSGGDMWVAYAFLAGLVVLVLIGAAYKYKRDK